MVKLENWSVTTIGGPYTAPEMWKPALAGNVYGHPKFNDGDAVRTSVIEKVRGRTVITHSGSEYKLGKIDPNYRKWIKKHRPNWDWRKPISVIEEH